MNQTPPAPGPSLSLAVAASSASGESDTQRYLPVLIHCWFSAGEGWAYSQLAPDRLEHIMRVVEPHLSGNIRERLWESPSCVEALVIPVSGGEEYLVGEHLADREQFDPRAAGRCPTVLRVALVSKRSLPATAIAVREQLRSLRPAGPGLDANLRVEAVWSKNSNDAESAGIVRFWAVMRP